MLTEVRCSKCSKLLAKAKYTHIQIKCPRCGTINDMRAESFKDECHRAPLPRRTNNGKTTRTLDRRETETR